ncbi:MAG: hypothetical protein V2B18_15550 [Pseudomonadota bacterium]
MRNRRQWNPYLLCAVRAVLGIASMFLCALVAMIPAAAVTLLIGWLVPIGGRREGAVVLVFTAVLIILAAAAFRAFRGWKSQDFVAALLSMEVITLLIIADISGYTGAASFHHFNMEWLIGLNLFFGLPWILGMGLGEIARVNGITNLKKLKERAKLMKRISGPQSSHPPGKEDAEAGAKPMDSAAAGTQIPSGEPSNSTAPGSKGPDRKPHSRKRRGW